MALLTASRNCAENVFALERAEHSHNSGNDVLERGLQTAIETGAPEPMEAAILHVQECGAAILVAKNALQPNVVDKLPNIDDGDREAIRDAVSYLELAMRALAFVGYAIIEK